MPTGRRAAGTLTAVRLVAGLTLRDLRRNVGAWRLPALSSLLFAVLFVGSAVLTDALQDRAADLEFTVAVAGPVDEARQALAALDETRLVIEEHPDALDAVREREAVVGLRLPPDLDERLLAGDPVELEVVQRAERNPSQEGTGWLLVSLAQVSGREPTVALVEADLNDDPGVARRAFGRTVAGLTAFLGLGVVTSVAAIVGGARDRRGVEPLLVTPLPRAAVTAGTVLGALPMGVLYVGTGLALLLGASTLPLPTLRQPAAVITEHLVLTVVVVVAIAALGAGLGVVAGALGGGGSDAMGVGDLLAVPLAAVGVLLLLLPGLDGALAVAAVPGLGVLVVLRDALGGHVHGALVGPAVASTVVAATLLVRVAGRLLGRERNVGRV